MIGIIPLSHRHTREVALLHMQYIPITYYSGTPGARLLQAHYDIVAEGHGAAGFVAEDDGSRVVAFICGMWDQAATRHALLSRAWPRLIFWGSAQLLMNPRLLVTLLTRLVGADRRQEEGLSTGYELRPIVVTPGVQGSGIATQLVEVLLADARHRGYDTVHLFADSDNERAHAFYRKSGFQRTSESSVASRLRYERSTADLT